MAEVREAPVPRSSRGTRSALRRSLPSIRACCRCSTPLPPSGARLCGTSSATAVSRLDPSGGCLVRERRHVQRFKGQLRLGHLRPDLRLLFFSAFCLLGCDLRFPRKQRRQSSALSLVTSARFTPP